MTKCVTLDGSRRPELMYVFPNCERDQAIRRILSSMYMVPGPMNHFQKFGPCSIVKIQNGMYNKCDQ